MGKRGGESPKQKRNRHKNSYKQYGSPYESSSEHSSIQSIDLPMEYQTSLEPQPVQYFPQEDMQFYTGHPTQQQFVPMWQPPELFPNIQIPPFQIPQVQDIFNEVQLTPIQPEYFFNQFSESFKNVTNYMFKRS